MHDNTSRDLKVSYFPLREYKENAQIAISCCMDQATLISREGGGAEITFLWPERPISLNNHFNLHNYMVGRVETHGNKTISQKSYVNRKKDKLFKTQIVLARKYNINLYQRILSSEIYLYKT